MSSTLCPACNSESAPDPAAPTLLVCRACSVRFIAAATTRLTMVTRVSGVFRHGASFDLTADFQRRYKLEKLLGEGAMGMVFLVNDKKGVPRAVKFLSRVSSGEGMIRFLREGRMMKEIRHPNIVEVLEINEVDGIPYLVCEYMTGGSLRDRLKREGAVTVKVALEVMDGVLSGLHECHLRGIVHRDLKPDNILFDNFGNAKISDLGIAKNYVDEGDTITRTGALIGTPLYMSPEQACGEPAVVASDIYAAGLILYELLAGRPPFRGENVVELLEQHTSAPPPPLPAEVKGVPERVVQAIRRALAKRAADRPASAHELATMLRSRSSPVRARPAAAPPSAIALPSPRFLIAWAGVMMFAAWIALSALVGPPAHIPEPERPPIAQSRPPDPGPPRLPGPPPQRPDSSLRLADPSPPAPAKAPPTIGGFNAILRRLFDCMASVRAPCPALRELEEFGDEIEPDLDLALPAAAYEGASDEVRRTWAVGLAVVSVPGSTATMAWLRAQLASTDPELVAASMIALANAHQRVEPVDPSSAWSSCIVGLALRVARGVDASCTDAELDRLIAGCSAMTRHEAERAAFILSLARVEGMRRVLQRLRTRATGPVGRMLADAERAGLPDDPASAYQAPSRAPR